MSEPEKKRGPPRGTPSDPRCSRAPTQAGDKAGANAALKALVKDTKLTKYVSDGIVSGSKFVDAVGMPSGEIDPDVKAL